MFDGQVVRIHGVSFPVSGECKRKGPEFDFPLPLPLQSCSEPISMHSCRLTLACPHSLYLESARGPEFAFATPKPLQSCSEPISMHSCRLTLACPHSLCLESARGPKSDFALPLPLQSCSEPISMHSCRLTLACPHSLCLGSARGPEFDIATPKPLQSCSDDVREIFDCQVVRIRGGLCVAQWVWVDQTRRTLLAKRAYHQCWRGEGSSPAPGHWVFPSNNK